MVHNSKQIGGRRGQTDYLKAGLALNAVQCSEPSLNRLFKGASTSRFKDRGVFWANQSLESSDLDEALSELALAHRLELF